MASLTTRKPLLLLGPTASGKSGLAMRLARRYRASGSNHQIEIISLDSALVYRGMDIGTAKPSREDRQEVVHHLIDILEPNQSYSAAQFAKDCRLLCDEVSARGHWPVIVGGTMLYARTLLQGLDALPGANPEVRARLDEQASKLGWPALHARLMQIDPPTAIRLKPNDSQRIQRALELFEITGRPMSELIDKRNQASRRESIQPLACQVISLEPSIRSRLHHSISERFDQMIRAGFVDEVKKLMQRSDLSPEMPSMRCVGYRQAWEFLSTCEGNPTQQAFESFRQKAIAATRQLAKRQLTWLRSLAVDQRFDSLSPRLDAEVHTYLGIR